MLALLALLFFVGLPVLMFFGALLEKRSLRLLIPMSDEDAPSSENFTEFYEKAEQLNLLPIGVYRDEESSILPSTMCLFISNDGVVAMRMYGLLGSPDYRLISHMDNATWLVSSETVEGVSLSRYKKEMMWPDCTFEQVHSAHRDWVAEQDAEPILFDPSTLVKALLQHDLEVGEQAVADGLAYWLNEEKTVYRCTLRGAWHLAYQQFIGLGKFHNADRRVKAFKKEWYKRREDSTYAFGKIQVEEPE